MYEKHMKSRFCPMIPLGIGAKFQGFRNRFLNNRVMLKLFKWPLRKSYGGE